jgi:hypothetical protein
VGGRGSGASDRTWGARGGSPGHQPRGHGPWTSQWRQPRARGRHAFGPDPPAMDHPVRVEAQRLRGATTQSTRGGRPRGRRAPGRGGPGWGPGTGPNPHPVWRAWMVPWCMSQAGYGAPAFCAPYCRTQASALPMPPRVSPTLTLIGVPAHAMASPPRFTAMPQQFDDEGLELLGDCIPGVAGEFGHPHVLPPAQGNRPCEGHIVTTSRDNADIQGYCRVLGSSHSVPTPPRTPRRRC